ncbi:flagellar export chaperone FliS [Aliidiomarina maris]|uniref:Flagellar secretion chaperone FliS n=1 Tax=Aliidiomarina maris TaxID=531312 RepID=A0A327X3F2_9GAMM|nr:flagellar export chaperone FliS [Aliidiomarina maris]MBA3988919.1 flagellar export chaperone FliS [Idiomarina sp.]RAK00742.1 flagellar protein FliS [Aliidiomarina maris]RUO27258.1 flagellar export chaperone FliS [Aliidiomarina maris]
MYNKGVKAYQNVGGRDQASTADPYEIIQMLMAGAIQKLAIAKGAIERKDYSVKSENLTKALSIVTALQDGLDMTVESELVTNMFELYDFVKRQIIDASAQNSIAAVDTSIRIMRDLKEGWDSIPYEARMQGYAEREAKGVMSL